MKIPIEDQVSGLREAVVAHESYIRTVRRLVKDGERPEEILKDVEQRLPKMQAALKTLEWVQTNREIIIQIYQKTT